MNYRNRSLVRYNKKRSLNENKGVRLSSMTARARRRLFENANLPGGYTVYIIPGACDDLVNALMNGDVDEFAAVLMENDYSDMISSVTFNTEAEANAFAEGLGFGFDPHYPGNNNPVFSYTEADAEYARLLEEYC